MKLGGDNVRYIMKTLDKKRLDLSISVGLAVVT
jgi:hypothetical protein